MTANNFLLLPLKWILFATPAVLLVVPDHMFFPFISGKGMLFRLLVEIALGLYLFLAITERQYRPQKSPVLIAVSAFAGIVLVADIFSPNFPRAFWSNFERMEGFLLIAHLCAYFVILGSVLKTHKDWSWFFYSSIAVSVAMNLYGWFQYFGGTIINQGSTRLDALMGNSSYFAGFLMFQTFMVVFLAKRDGVNQKNILWAFFSGSVLFSAVYLLAEKSSALGNYIMLASVLCSAIALFCHRRFNKHPKIWVLPLAVFSAILVSHVALLFLTQTRGAALGFLGGGLVVSALILIFEKYKPIRIVGAAILISTLFVVIGFIGIKDSSFIQGSPVFKRFAEISWSETKSQARQIIWPMALSGAKEKPILGWGQEGFNYIFPKYYDTELYHHEPWFDRTHNVYLDWLVAAGLLGLFAYLSIYAASIYSIKKTLLTTKPAEAAILLGLLAAYAFQNLFIFDNLGSYILFFSLIAFLHSAQLPPVLENEEKEKITKEKINPLMLAGLCLLVSATAIALFVYKPYKQNTSLIKALQPQANILENLRLFKEVFSEKDAGLTEAREQFFAVLPQIMHAPNLSPQIKQQFWDEAVSQARNAANEKPLAVNRIVFIAATFNQIGAPDIALELLEPIRKISPKKQQILNQIGITHMVKNDLNAAYDILKEAYQLSPKFSESAMLFASIAIHTNRAAEALAILTRFAEEGDAPPKFIINDLTAKGLKSELIGLLEILYKNNPTDELKAALGELKK